MPVRRIFTLIELLIVISIIAILAGMLLPVLKQAREQGYSILCKGNLKQIGTALLNYSMDFNENIMYCKTPYPAYSNGSVSDRPWFELLGNIGPYSQLDYGVKIGCLYNKNTFLKRTILCPSQKIGDNTFVYTDYAANIWFFGSIETADSYKNHSLKMMQRPSEIVLVADNGDGSGHSVSYPYNAGIMTYNGFCVRSNHVSKTANFLFGDMHVSQIIREKIGIDSTILRQGFDYTQGN